MPLTGHHSHPPEITVTVSTDLQALAIQELYAWLQLAQEDLHQARSLEDELESEALCDVIVTEILARVA
jgi:hypothetical protein